MKQAMAFRISIIATAINCFWLYPFAQGSVSATYTAADIPTSFNAFSPPCNGSSIQLQLVLPAGESYPVTGINIAYSMTALGVGQMAHQRSQVKCVNTGVTESAVYEGVGSATGTFPYARLGVSIANGEYAGGTVLVFEMHAWRTVEGIAGCNTLVNRVNAGSWTITVFYGNQNIVPRVGVNTNAPAASLDVAGKIKLADDFILPQAGMVRWNAQNGDFEGYNGKEWISLTKPAAGWGVKTIPTENLAAYQPDPSSDDLFGEAVSMSGNYAIVGSRFKTVGSNFRQGQAYIFVRNSEGWALEATLTDNAGSVYDLFGSSVSINGDYAIVGAPNKYFGSKMQGGACVFYRNAGTWTQQVNLVASDGLAADRFGSGVAISGNYAIIGAAGKKVGTNSYQGQAYIFYRNGTVWTEQSILLADDGDAQDQFGERVSISGSYAVVGVPTRKVNNNYQAGVAYIYNRLVGLPGQPAYWVLQETLKLENGASNEGFGSSVAIAGTYIVIGAPSNLFGSKNTGKAYIFNRVRSTWNLQAVLAPDDVKAYESFGSSVAIDGDYIIVAADQKNVGANERQGKAYVFYHSGNTWEQQSALIASDGQASDGLGIVSISGLEILIGVPLKKMDTQINVGKVYFFKRN
jgi:hypothetical protein